MTADHGDSSGYCLLIIEDSPSDAAMLEADLRDRAMPISRIDRAKTLSEAQKLLAGTTYDAVLVDLGLPDSDGLETFAAVSSAASTAAILVVTGFDDSRTAAEAVMQGAQDYLVKDRLRPLEVARAVNYAIQRQRLLDELRQARDDQLAAKDRFLTHVSHELRSPLAVVHQFASLLLDGIGGEVSAEQRELLSVLMRNVLQLKVMIDDLVDVSHGEQYEFAIRCQPVAPMTMLSEAVTAYRPLAERNHIDLQLAEDQLPDVTADAARVREVLGNLLDNALKFTPPGGSVLVSARREDGQVRVTVRDTGRGIAEADLPHIFEQFFQVNQDDEARNGLGLGLFVSRELIARQGGEMEAESVPGVGTSVSFTLPTVAHGARAGVPV